MAGVTLAMPVYKDIPRETVRCLLQTQQALINAGTPYTIDFLSTCSVVHYARNYLAKNFLARPHDLLFFVDSDITWKADDFLKFMALSEHMPVLCAPMSLKKEPPQAAISFVSDDRTLNEYGCLPIAACALGFTVVRRDIMAQLSSQAPTVNFFDFGDVPYVFRGDAVHEGRALSEDAAFYQDVRNNGHAVHMDFSVELGHIGAKEYRLPV